MGKESDSYNQILKATSIFGGVQAFQIIIRIVRAKFIAVLLGPTGMGIASLLGSTTQFIAAITNFGLGTSAVKEISAANATGELPEVSRKTAVVRRWVWITGLLGSIITLVLAPWLSELTFGNDKYTYAFAIISITLLLNQISVGQNVLLRGMRKIKFLAQASVLGSVLGLLTTLPLYYFLGIDGIVPGIIVTSLTTLSLSWYFSQKVKIKTVKVSFQTTVQEGKEMMKLGFMLSLSGMITLGVSYIVRIFISQEGGVDQVGFYNAGFSIINSYVGMIFTAMSTDFYPRLSGVATDVKRRNLEINQQAEVAVIILAPIILIFMIFIKWGIIILYSAKFLPVVDMILWAVLGILFKAGCWAIGFLFLAKGASKLFFWNELSFNFYYLLLNLGGYYFLGLKGLGISFILSYGLYMLQVFMVTRKRYDFKFNRGFLKIFVFQLSLGILCLCIVLFTSDVSTYILGSLLIGISLLYTYRELNKRMDIKNVLKNLRKKITNKK